MKQPETPTILLTGATGTVGTHLVKELSEKKISFKALVRSSEQVGRFASLQNAELVFGDLNDKESIKKALTGIERVFLLTNSSREAEQLQLNLVEAAPGAGVQHIVKLSQYAARVDSPVRFLRYHAAIENAILNAGIQYTFLRPNLYMQGLLAFREYIINNGQFFASVGDAKASAIDVRDIAAVAAEVLVNDHHRNQVYNLTGPAAITHYQMADYLTKALNRNVQYINVSPERIEQGLKGAGFPEWQVEGLIEDYGHYARGEAKEVSSAVEDVTGKPARNFGDFAMDHRSFFMTRVHQANVTDR